MADDTHGHRRGTEIDQQALVRLRQLAEETTEVRVVIKFRLFEQALRARQDEVLQDQPHDWRTLVADLLELENDLRLAIANGTHEGEFNREDLLVVLGVVDRPLRQEDTAP
jgi:hypothetical protein